MFPNAPASARYLSGRLGTKGFKSHFLIVSWEEEVQAPNRILKVTHKNYRRTWSNCRGRKVEPTGCLRVMDEADSEIPRQSEILTAEFDHLAASLTPGISDGAEWRTLHLRMKGQERILLNYITISRCTKTTIPAM